MSSDYFANAPEQTRKLMSKLAQAYLGIPFVPDEATADYLAEVIESHAKALEEGAARTRAVHTAMSIIDDLESDEADR